MDENLKKSLTDKEKWAQKEAEKAEIMLNASMPKGQLNIIDQQGELGLIDEVRQINFSDTDDPEKKYGIYYKEIERLLKRMLNPKANKETKAAFKILREERNIFLTRGKRLDDKGRRNGDVRMAYIPDMEVAANMIYENMAVGGNPYTLYCMFRDKNIELGYYNDLKSNLKGGETGLSLRKDDKIWDVLQTMKKNEEKE